MNARDRILKAVSENRPSELPLPAIDLRQVTRAADPLEAFRTVLGTIGAASVLLPSMQALAEELNDWRARGVRVLNRVHGAGDVDAIEPDADAASLADVEVACLRGAVSVAENGAIWVPEGHMGHRLLPFICTRLMLVVDRADIVGTMHDAYLCTDTFAEGFGTFIAGPSKTADIEQSLVIGAHGAKGLTVYII